MDENDVNDVIVKTYHIDDRTMACIGSVRYELPKYIESDKTKCMHVFPYFNSTHVTGHYAKREDILKYGKKIDVQRN